MYTSSLLFLALGLLTPHLTNAECTFNLLRQYPRASRTTHRTSVGFICGTSGSNQDGCTFRPNTTLQIWEGREFSFNGTSFYTELMDIANRALNTQVWGNEGDEYVPFTTWNVARGEAGYAAFTAVVDCYEGSFSPDCSGGAFTIPDGATYTACRPVRQPGQDGIEIRGVTHWIQTNATYAANLTALPTDEEDYESTPANFTLPSSVTYTVQSTASIAAATGTATRTGTATAASATPTTSEGAAAGGLGEMVPMGAGMVGGAFMLVGALL